MNMYKKLIVVFVCFLLFAVAGCDEDSSDCLRRNTLSDFSSVTALGLSVVEEPRLPTDPELMTILQTYNCLEDMSLISSDQAGCLIDDIPEIRMAGAMLLLDVLRSPCVFTSGTACLAQNTFINVFATATFETVESISTADIQNLTCMQAQFLTTGSTSREDGRFFEEDTAGDFVCVCAD